VGLQRMFAHETERPDTTTDSPRATGMSSHYSSSGFATSPAESEPPHYSRDLTTNTITFSSPTVQREAESAPAADPAPDTTAPEPAAAPASAAPAVSIASAVTAAAAGGKELDVDNLVSSIYDTLAARLRAELWQDRERAGVLMDLGR
jgi:hypothetical protein